MIDQFCCAMREQDIHVSLADIRADGKLHRIRAEGDRDKTVWYVLHADDRPAGMFGCNRRYGYDQKFTWKADIKRAPMTAAEKRAYRERMERLDAERAAQLAADRAAAAEHAQRLWNEAAECDAHSYLERKGIRSHGLRVGRWEVIDQDTGEARTVTNEALLIPIRDLKKKIHSLQAIMPEKREGAPDKWYLQDGAKEGNFSTIGRPLEHNGKQVIIICEGYATGASIHEATGHAVIVAFDAPNLLPVAKVWRERFPDAIIIIAADNDQFTLKPIKNPGVARAREAAAAVDALVAVPPFASSLGATNERGGRAHGPTDFNDLQQLEGQEAICGVIDEVLSQPLEAASAFIEAALEIDALAPVVLVPRADEIGDICFAFDVVDFFSNDQAVGQSMRGVVAFAYGECGLQAAAESARRFFPGAELKILAELDNIDEARRVAEASGAHLHQPPAGGEWCGWADHLWREMCAVTGSQILMKSVVRSNVAPAMQADYDPTAPIAMGVSGDLFGFWTREGKVELIRASDVFKDAGILRLQDLAYWQAYCTEAGASTTGGKYDRTMVGNALIQKSKLVGALDARNVPGSVASPEVVQRELNLALMHAKPNAYAVAQVLLAHPDWQGVVWMNKFAERVEARVDPPCGGGAGPWTDRHDMLLGAWLSAQYGVSVSKPMVVAAVGLLAHADQRHPVRDYLDPLAWDGVPRLDTWLTTFAGCQDDTYTRHVGAKSMIGAVARIMQPGVKFDTMLVLEGDQGLRKSTLICALAPNEEWFTDSLDGDLGSKDAAIGLAGKWLIEVPEMATLGRTRVEVVKSFLTRRVDHFRAPHAVRAEDHPRQCAFFGTINPEADGRYLSDTTGGRRFWPVQVRKADVQALKADRDQLWAEAVARYKAGEQWWLTDEIEALAKHEQAIRQESNPWADHVERFLAYLPPDQFNPEWGGKRTARLEQVSTSEIYLAVMGGHITVKDQKDSKAIAAALKSVGWAQKRGTMGTGRYWVRE
ncbi:VapE domain-containing protein [Bradyrhizobium sp. Leo170]|uniref:VapE domain-containing protein n=1 Tax=Bradyrhizobium sp. Leo170 TaxID=1571199 RepID=UPI0013EE7769|nr:VapE domain-containing protein [Bradyrhizobium sp. Leo170]